MNNYTIVFTESYVQRARKFFKRHPDIIPPYEKCLQILVMNPFHPSLRLHPMHGKLQGLYSISITMGYRLTFEFVIDDKEIIPIHTGTHDEAYT